jgi:hypothetical protein
MFVIRERLSAHPVYAETLYRNQQGIANRLKNRNPSSGVSTAKNFQEMFIL